MSLANSAGLPRQHRPRSREQRNREKKLALPLNVCVEVLPLFCTREGLCGYHWDPPPTVRARKAGLVRGRPPRLAFKASAPRARSPLSVGATAPSATSTGGTAFALSVPATLLLALALLAGLSATSPAAGVVARASMPLAIGVYALTSLVLGLGVLSGITYEPARSHIRCCARGL